MVDLARQHQSEEGHGHADDERQGQVRDPADRGVRVGGGRTCKQKNRSSFWEGKYNFDVALQIANGNVPTHVTYPKNYILAVAG